MGANKFIQKKERQRKRKKRFRNIIILIVLVIILINLVYKIPYFDIKHIKVQNNNIVSTEEIYAIGEKVKGENIFYTKLDSIQKEIKKNTYVDSVEIERKLPSTIIVKVNEKKPFFYINNEKKYYVFSEDAKLIDIKDSMADLEVPEVVGLELGDIKLGESIVFNKDNKRKVKYISDLFLNISNPIDDSFDKKNISLIEIPEFFNCSFKYKNLTIKLGKDEEILDKLNKAFQIIKEKEYQDSIGYIDVSYYKLPAVHIEG
ncbi:FtsQ-type POTRA domain-containing protein [Clostridium bornimense]|uniref:cell division protein FtsQ/DivIB n=1 Tax=Clostridium bornimense TaxID=1216932 RepID=UPI001C118598|nr:FtsQ-type POTRA domain-containing protein [Clostridium bornimense]MBU5314733.1 FtsQ-type POTRA domain-containing protein [Clostridium bornimense]